MTGLKALLEMKRAHEAVRRMARSIPAESPDPELRAHRTRLIDAVADLESNAQKELAALLHRPLPAPEPKLAGAWTGRILSSETAQRAMESIEAPEWIGPVAVEIARQAGALVAWAAASPEQREAVVQQAAVQQAAVQQEQPRAGAFAGPGTAAAVPAAAGIPMRVKVGIGVGILYQVANIGIAMYAAHEAKKQQPFDDADKPKGKRRTHDIGEIEDGAQQALDQAMPGARLSLAQTPDGRWVASVRRGLDTVARKSGKSAGEAASDAVQAAVDTTLKADGDVIDADFVVLPAKPAAPESAAAAGQER